MSLGCTYSAFIPLLPLYEPQMVPASQHPFKKSSMSRSEHDWPLSARFLHRHSPLISDPLAILYMSCPLPFTACQCWLVSPSVTTAGRRRVC